MYIVCYIDCKLELYGVDFVMIKGISYGIGKGVVFIWDCYIILWDNDYC